MAGAKSLNLLITIALLHLIDYDMYEWGDDACALQHTESARLLRSHTWPVATTWPG